MYNKQLLSDLCEYENATLGKQAALIYRCLTTSKKRVARNIGIEAEKVSQQSSRARPLRHKTISQTRSGIWLIQHSKANN